MQTPISKGVTTNPSTAQVLELWSRGYRPDVTPPHTLANGPTDGKGPGKCLFSKGFLNDHPLANLLANGPPDDLPGVCKKDMCMSMRNPFSCPQLSRLDRPFLSSERPPSAKWRTKTLKTCLFLGDFDPFRHISCLAEGGRTCIICYTDWCFLAFRQWAAMAEGGQRAISIWRVGKTGNHHGDHGGHGDRILEKLQSIFFMLFPVLSVCPVVRQSQVAISIWPQAECQKGRTRTLRKATGP